MAKNKKKLPFENDITFENDIKTFIGSKPNGNDLSKLEKPNWNDLSKLEPRPKMPPKRKEKE